MADEQREGGRPPGEARVKVVDRRRFREDGEPVEPAEPLVQATPSPEAEETAAQAPLASEVAEKLAAQEKRIDELLRAYAALVEDNKAFRQRQEREKVRVIEAERAGHRPGAARGRRRPRAGAGGGRRLRGARRGHAGPGRGRAALAGGAPQADRGPGGRADRRSPGRRSIPRWPRPSTPSPVSDADQDGCVVQEVRSGYRIGERILRPARVRVGRLAQGLARSWQPGPSGNKQGVRA